MTSAFEGVLVKRSAYVTEFDPLKGKLKNELISFFGDHFESTNQSVIPTTLTLPKSPLF
jgi:hypothetical protein